MGKLIVFIMALIAIFFISSIIMVKINEPKKVFITEDQCDINCKEQGYSSGVCDTEPVTGETNMLMYVYNHSTDCGAKGVCCCVKPQIKKEETK